MVRQLSELYDRYPQFPPEYYEKLKIVQQGFLVSGTACSFFSEMKFIICQR